MTPTHSFNQTNADQVGKYKRLNEIYHNICLYQTILSLLEHVELFRLENENDTLLDDCYTPF